MAENKKDTAKQAPKEAEVKKETAKKPVKEAAEEKKETVKKAVAEKKASVKEKKETVKKAVAEKKAEKTAEKKTEKAAEKKAVKKTPAKKPAAKKPAVKKAEEVKAVVKEAQAPVFISEDDRYLFGTGTHYDIYKKLGAHMTTVGGKQGVFFAVWAPHAAAVHVIGSFNDWNEDQYLMERQGDSGIFTLFIKDVKEGDYYKFLIHTPGGEKLYKADPFANYAELRPGTASRI